MARLAVPYFGYPDRIFIGSVLGDHIAEASAHIGGALLQDCDHFIALAGNKGYLPNHSPHPQSSRNQPGRTPASPSQAVEKMSVDPFAPGFSRLVPIRPSLTLVADLSQEFLARVYVGRALHTFGRTSVDHSDDPTTLLGIRQDELHRIGRGTENRAHLRHVLQHVQQIDGISVAYDQHKHVACRRGLRVADSHLAQLLVIAFGPRKAWTGSLVEGHPEFRLRHGVHHRFIDILYAFDEMGLSHNDVAVLGKLHCDGFEFNHGVSLASGGYYFFFCVCVPPPCPANAE